MNSDKQNYEKEEIKDRYKAMDSMVRAEFQRKDEALNTLQFMIETQVSNLQNVIKQEEANRYQSETMLREDYLKFQEMFRRVYFMNKSIKLLNYILKYQFLLKNLNIIIFFIKNL